LPNHACATSNNARRDMLRCARNAPDQRIAKAENKMEVADLVLPVFAIIVTGWLAGWLGYISRSLADGLVHFAYNIAMPALLFVADSMLAPTELQGGWMTRQGFITLLGISALIWAHAVCAQQPEPIRRVGVLHSTAADDSEGEVRIAAFLQGLQQSGWTIGRNLTIYTRWGRANADEIRKYARNWWRLPQTSFWPLAA
jgi:hypothetical protein